MRADKPMDESTCVDMYRRVVITDYINQLRYERAIAKAKYFRLAEYLLNISNRMKYRYRRIAEAYEARAKQMASAGSS